MSTYNEFVNEFLYQNGFLTEKEFNEVLDSFPGLEFDLNVIAIFDGAIYDENMVAEEIVYSKLFKEGLDTDKMELESWSVDVDTKEIYLLYAIETDEVVVPVDQIKGYFPNYTVEIEIEIVSEK
jgi:hypothetical protein